MFLGAALALLQLASSGGWSTGRPAECGEPWGRTANVWERAKSPDLQRYCDLLASASSKLAGTAAMAERALEAAREADKVLPGRAAPRVLEGRALEALGKIDEALGALEEGRALQPGALDDPPALLAWARALARKGQTERAAEAYRALLPRAAVLSAVERSAAEIEAGLVAMSRGPDRLDEAIAALREGEREAHDEPHAVAVLALAVALDRRGEVDASRALLVDRSRGDPRVMLATPRARELVAVAPAEPSAMSGLGLETSDPTGARDAWQAYVSAAPRGPWAANASAHLAGLSSRRRAR